jgi:peptide/nickel transport system substrate-binding protein
MSETITMNFNRRQVLKLMGLAGTAAAAYSFTGVNGAIAAGTDQSGRVTIAFTSEPVVFHPHKPHMEVDEAVHSALFDTLIGIDEKGEYFPILASEVPTVANGGISADGLNWVIKLRDGVKWHDGKPFTAEDVKFNIELLVNPDFASWRKTGHEFVRDIEVVSATELKFRLERSYAPYAAILASTPIIPKHAYEGVTNLNEAPFDQAPIGTGPFKWGTRVTGDHVELVANTEYFGEGPFLEAAVFKYIPDTSVFYTQFKTGDFDLVGIQYLMPDNYEEAKGLEGKTVELVGNGYVESFTLNMQRPQFADPKVRQALYLAIDKTSIIDALYYGTMRPTESFMPQESFYFNGDLPKHEFNIEAANKLLDEAGWVKGADGIRAKDGVRLSFSNSTTAGNQLREQTQQFLQQTFKDIGAEMTISNLPPAVMWGDYWMKSEFDSVIVGLNVMTGSDPECSDYFKSTSAPATGGTGQNTWVYKNEKVDELLNKGAELTDPQERLSVYHDIQSLIRADLPFLPLFQYQAVRGYKTGLEGIRYNINTRADAWNIATWRWAKA